MKTLRNMPFKGENNIFKFLEEKLSLANLSKEERAHYEEELKIARDNNAVMIGARMEGKTEMILEIVRKLLGKGQSQEEIIELLDIDPAIFGSI